VVVFRDYYRLRQEMRSTTRDSSYNDFRLRGLGAAILTAIIQTAPVGTSYQVYSLGLEGGSDWLSL
jgi:purine-cytosine permease-like protein